MAEAGAIKDESVPEAGKPRRFSKKLMIIAGIVVLLLVGGGVAAYVFLAKGDTAETPAGKDHAKGEDGAAVTETYVEVPPVIVNLRSADGAVRLLKVSLMLVPVDPTTASAITARLPTIIDSFQPFLRELRPEDLAGSAAVFRIKEELLIQQ